MLQTEGIISATSLKWDIDYLNKKYLPLTPAQRIAALYKDFGQDDILFTSSFGTTAVLLLDMFHKVNPHQPIHFIDTGYHFEETLAYKNQLAKRYDLNVIDLKAEDWKHDMTTQSRIWETHPDLCCSINKVEPLDEVKGNYKIWVSGLMAWQTDNRKTLKVFTEKDGIIKFSPLVDISEQDAMAYIEDYQLPIHPLKPLGYESVGCKFCTLKGSKREGRWVGKAKTECGLHQ
jgi:phosphoadenosine phosphosulfate reductase